NTDVISFTLRVCDFDKAPNLVGARFSGPINITRLSTKEPIKIFWPQFGDKWLADLKGSHLSPNCGQKIFIGSFVESLVMLIGPLNRAPTRFGALSKSHTLKVKLITSVL